MTESEIFPPEYTNGKAREIKQSPYFNRELSWIEFNRRVLEEAMDRSQPLLERLRFLCIFSTNLDEFFMIRVSGLRQQIEAGIDTPSPDGMTPAENLAAIAGELRFLIDQQVRCLTEDLLPLLAVAGIKVLPYSRLTRGQQRQMREYFEKEVYPVLTPLVVDPGHPFPHISNLSLNLGVELQDPEDLQEIRFARIKVPDVLPRLVPLPPRRSSFVLLEEIISANIARLFPGMTILNCHPFRITRDADLEIEEDEADDLLKTIEANLRRRHFGQAVRLQVDHQIPPHLCDMLLKVLRLDAQDCFMSNGPVGIADFMSLVDLPRQDLKHEPFEPVCPEHLKPGTDIFEAISCGDILLHHPFESFAPVIDFLRQAARDPRVLAIKLTLYRTSGDSPIVDAIIEAALSGKQVAVLLELKARFDEENNINWARKLEEVGVHVVYGVIGLKTHAKVALVVRRESDGLRRYVHLSTGNYNSSTARVYTDLGFLTCRPELGADASALFNFLTGFCKHEALQKLLVAPYNLRESLLNLIKREAHHHQANNPGHIIVKVNSLTDTEIIDALYYASRKGVRIDLIVRGNCCLKPGIPGLSENIRVVSVVGRFLEHSRVCYFKNRGKEEVYLSSADWMYRNLNRRVETLFPVEDPVLLKRIRDEILTAYLHDNVRARHLNSDGSYERRSPAPGQPEVDSQAILMGRGKARVPPLSLVLP